ncbi:hypothetical protein JCM8097_006582 [Rhodosporidiobolus ruineniae]
MAIFSSSRKDKHKKNGGPDGSASGQSSSASPPINQAQFPRSQSQGLGGSFGRSEGSGIPVPSAGGGGGGPGGGGSGMYASTSSQGGPPAMGQPMGVAPMMGHTFSGQGQGIPPPGSMQHFQQQQPPHPHHPPPSHTVLYPWSQRPVQLLPSQLLPPNSSPNAPASPSLALEPVPGPVSPLPFPRYGHSVNPLAAAQSSTGDLYVFGGLVQNTVKNDLYVIHCAPPPPPPLSSEKSALASPAAAGPTSPLQVALLETRGEVPGPRVGHASVSVGNVLIVWGGDTKTRAEERQDDGLYLLNLSTREWTRVKTLGRAPEGRYGHAAAMVGSRFFVFGGQTDDGGFKNDLAWFDLQKLKQGQPRWSFVDYAPGQVVPPPRTGHTCITHGDCLYIFGGTDGSYHYNDTWQYDLTTGQWTELACIGYIPVPREGHAATLVDDVMYVFGGRGVDGKDLEDLAAFKISNHRWFMFQNMGPAPSGRSGHAMATWQTKVLVLGGESYTSQRADDPSIVHVLDTTKIKYPPDSARPAQQAQQQQQLPPPAPSSPSSHPPSQLPQPGSLSSSLNGVPGAPSAAGAQRKSSIPVSPDLALRDRAASPTGSARGLKSSLSSLQGAAVAQTMLNGGGGGSSTGSIGRSGIPQPASPTGASKIAKRATTSGAPPTRPARPDDAEAFSAGTVPAPGAAGGVEQKLRQQVSLEALRSGQQQPNQGQGSPQMASLSGFAAQQAQQQQQQQQQGGGEGAPSDAFYVPNSAGSSTSAAAAAVSEEKHRRELADRDERIADLEKRERWVLAALRGAKAKGFVGASAPSATSDSEEEGEGEEEGEKTAVLEDVGKREREKKVMEAVVVLKGELAKAKTLLAEQASSLGERFQGAERARSAALQEAAYYRAKVAALESASPAAADAAFKLDRERTADLEKKLAEALSSRSELEAQVARLEQDAEQHSSLHSTAQAQAKEIAQRADAAEQSHARALADLADLQKRTHGHERSLAEHVEQLASLKSSHATLEADNARFKAQVEEHDQSLSGYLRALEASQEALTAAQARNDDLAASYDKATGELTAQQLRVAELEQQVEKLQVERDAAVARADEADRVLRMTREAHDKTHALASGGLADLLAAHKERQARRTVARSRSVDGDSSIAVDEDEDALPAHHLARLRAIEGEVSTVKQLHSDAQAKSDALAAELEAVRAREVDLHHQLGTLRAQLATAQEAHSTVSAEAASHRSLASQHEERARTVQRAKDAAEVKASVLRSLLVDHGLAAPSEDELSTKFAPLSGDESAEQLAQRVQELEGRAEAQAWAKETLEQRAREQEQEVERLRDEVERARQASRQGVEGAQEERERSEKAREELEQLQGRHQQLEATHLKAVQYVKGTEKMLRRMKEELTRYKERCEELESPERQAELDTLRQQVTDLHAASETSSRQHEELQQRMDQLQAEYQRTLREQQDEAGHKVAELQSEVGKLDQELEKAHAELEETLAVNASLNKELQTALKNPGSPRSGGGASSEDISRLQADLDQALNNAEWLKRENATLEQRCRTAESKIAILLDHMEGVQGDSYDASQHGSPHLAGDSPEQHQHQWSVDQHRRLSESDAGSEYDDAPVRR